MTITQRTEDERRQAFEFDDPDIDMEEDGVTEDEDEYLDTYHTLLLKQYHRSKCSNYFKPVRSS